MSCGRDLVDIQKLTETRDSTGGPIKTWTSLTKVLARDMKLVKAREDTPSTQGDRQAATETWLVTIPFRSDLVAITDYRAVIDAVNYNIRSATDRTRRRFEIVLEIERGVAI